MVSLHLFVCGDGQSFERGDIQGNQEGFFSGLENGRSLLTAPVISNISNSEMQALYDLYNATNGPG